MKEPKNTEEIRIRNRTLEKRICSDIKECDILYICAPIGWGKYALLMNIYHSYKGKIYWLERTENSSLEQQISELPQLEGRMIVLPHFEKIIQCGELEMVQKLIWEKKKEDVFLISSEIPFPKELLPYTLFHKICTYDTKDLKPSNSEVKKFFDRKGIFIDDITLLKIEEDYNNMPLCIYMLGNLLLDSGRKYSPVMKERCMADVYAYIDILVFRKLKIEEQEMLLRISCIENLDEVVMSYMLDISVKQVREFVQRLLVVGNILEEDNTGWKFNSLFEHYLNWVRHKYLDADEMRSMYRKAMNYEEKNENWLNAMHYAYILRDTEQLIEYLERKIISTEDYSEIVQMEVYFQELSLSSIMGHPLIMMYGTILEQINGDLKTAKKYQQMFEKYYMMTEDLDEKRKLEGQWIWLQLIDFGEVNIEQKRMNLTDIKAYVEKSKIENEKIFFPSQLSVLHGEQDYCDILANNEYGIDIFRQLRQQTEGVLGNIFSIMFCFAEAEVLYEQNKLEQALDMLSRTIWEIGTVNNQRIREICMIAMADLLVAKNQLDNVDDFISRKLEISSREHLLTYNIKAHQVYFYLLKNEKEKIYNWLQNFAPDEKSSFRTIFYSQYLMKAKVYIWKESYVLARLLLQTLLEFAQNYGMHYLEMQVRILEAVVYYREGNKQWREVLAPALDYAEKIHFVRVFADEGAAVYDLLQEYIEKDKKGVNNQFYKETLAAVRAHMLQYPQYMNMEKEIDINEFTVYERDIMKLLRNGDKNADIAKKLFVSENTIKYHLKKIYQKLDVKSRGQAVNKMKEYNLV